MALTPNSLVDAFAYQEPGNMGRKRGQGGRNGGGRYYYPRSRSPVASRVCLVLKKVDQIRIDGPCMSRLQLNNVTWRQAIKRTQFFQSKIQYFLHTPPSFHLPPQPRLSRQTSTVTTHLHLNTIKQLSRIILQSH